MRTFRCMFAGIILCSAASAVCAAQDSHPLQPFIVEDAPVIVMEHVRVIDGTGAPPAEDQTILIDHGKIAAVGSSVNIPAPGAKRMDLLPGPHRHPGAGRHARASLLSSPWRRRHSPIYNEQGYSFPRLYLASGVTTRAHRREHGTLHRRTLSKD